MPIKLGIVPVTPFEQNCSVLVCQKTGEAAVVDPGGDLDKILEVVKQMGGTVKKILLTHGHLDHCAGHFITRVSPSLTQVYHATKNI